MSEAVIEDDKSGAESAGWTQENLQKLVASLKDTLPENDKTQTYIRGLKAVDWDKVAFPPFSAGECKKKWNSIMGKIHKSRSLPDLLDEAEDLLSTPSCYKNIHPDLPKPPYPPKGDYIRKNMSKYARENPGVSRALITKALSEEYENLSDKYKAEDAKNYNIAFEEYSRKIRNFCKVNNLHLPISKKAKKRRRIVLEGGDEACRKYKVLLEKPPGSGFALFLKEHAQPDKVGKTTHGVSFLQLMGQRWKELSENEKQKYTERCAEMKRKYEANLMKYLDELSEKEKKQIIKEKRIKIPKKTSDRYILQPGEPKMPSQSGFIYFRSDMLKHAWKSMPRKECTERAKKEWHELSAIKKTQYAEIIQENMRKYTEELQAWFQTLTQEDQRVYLKKKPDKVTFLQKYIDNICTTSRRASDPEEKKTSRTKGKGRKKKKKKL